MHSLILKRTTRLAQLLLIGMTSCASLSQAAEHSGHGDAMKHDHGDNPLLVYGAIDHLEALLDSDQEAYALEAQGWIGKDLDKFWLKTDLSLSEGELEEAEVQALYSRALSSYWDLQAGIRHDDRPGPSRDWLVLAVQGLAPYWFNVEAALFVTSGGQTSARLQAEYELLITQQLVLSPQVSLTFYGQNDPLHATGAGLAEATAGLRLSYAFKREFAPYIGVNWRAHYGQTADYVRQQGEPVEHSETVVGLQAWF